MCTVEIVLTVFIWASTVGHKKRLHLEWVKLKIKVLIFYPTPAVTDNIAVTMESVFLNAHYEPCNTHPPLRGK